ncbi:MAG TPA: rod shape-determining protein RodA [Candidatus Angelobacter sp.]|nr:rod shape-determining protein RodA [Candidatus Angelobacter sp.]
MRWPEPLTTFRRAELTVSEKLRQITWSMLFFVVLIGCFGFAMLYSAAKGSVDPWAMRQGIRFVFGLGILVAVALVDIRVYLRYAYAIYGVAFLLLIFVDVAGEIGMGAQRWIDLKFIQLQPSEVMKIALVLALARYFHRLSADSIGNPLTLIVPIAMVFLPVGLVLMQPDLGTAVMLVLVGAAMFWVAGVRLWKFVVVALAGAGAVPLAWTFLHDYQKNRILTFLHPESDPLGTGYHITQSKIAMGSGGLAGKGFLKGSQAYLNYLPERQTDFIFAMLSEELGMIGGVLLLLLYTVLFVYGYAIAFNSRNHFGRLLAIGVTINLFCYVFINMAMVMGLLPVVGVPLPLISYGGTAMLTVLFGFGLMMCVYVHRDLKIGQRGLGDES